MKKRIVLQVIFMVVCLLSFPGLAARAQQPNPTTVSKSTFPVANPPAQFDLVQEVIDFAPGAWTPVHTHGGQGFVTVVQGELTLLKNGTEQKYSAGQSWVEIPGNEYQGGNTGTVMVRTLVTFLLPKGAKLTTPQKGTSAAPTTSLKPKSSEFHFVVTNAPAQFDVVNQEVDFAPGAWTPVHTHGGPAYITVLEGSMTTKVNGEEKNYQTGQSWVEYPGQYFAVGNTGTAEAKTFVTFLLAKGAPLTTLQQQGIPATGNAANSISPWYILPAAALIVVAGTVFEWARRRSAKKPSKPIS